MNKLLFGANIIFLGESESHILQRAEWLFVFHKPRRRPHYRLDRCERVEWKGNGKLFWKLSPIIRKLKKDIYEAFVVWHWHPKSVKGLRLDRPSPRNNRLAAIWSSFHVANFKTTAGPGGWSFPRAWGFADFRNVINGKSHFWLFMLGVDAKHVVCQGVRSAAC